ncbi:ABC transporter permease [Lentisphaerota bacterium WC36G]|nr:ABC transporter permease [Lentisphaerae bacterium WC36]
MKKSALLFFENVGNITSDLTSQVTSLVRFIAAVFFSLGAAVRHPKKVRWHETIYYINMCGSDALGIVILLCYLMGLITAYQSIVQLHKFGADIELTVLMNVAVCKELAALMVAIISTGRAGSAFAAEIGTMKINDEINALKTLGLSPERFLITPKIIAMCLVGPILTVFGMYAALIAGVVVAKTFSDIPVETYVTTSINYLKPRWIFEGMVKSLVYSFLIASIGCEKGFASQNDSKGVGRSTTSAVVSGIFWIVVANAIITYIFMKIFAK